MENVRKAGAIVASDIKITREQQEVNKTYSEYTVSERWKQYRSPAYFDYRRKWSENPRNMVLEDFPIHLDIEITNFCNLACTMCSRTVQIKEGTFGKLQHIDMDLFKKMIDEGANNKVSSVKFNYLGEPLMHPQIVEMVRYCKDKGIIDVIFNSNGVLLTDKISQNLLEAGLDGLFISFDSINKQQFEAIRVGAKFEKIIANVRKFHEIRNSNEKYWKTQIRISKVLFPEEEDKDIVAFIDMWKDAVDAIGFGSLIEVGNSAEISYKSYYRCDQPWQRLFVGVDGVAFPCCLDYKTEYVVGNIHHQTLKEIWHSEPYRKLREAHATGKYNEIDICKNCSYICASPVNFNS